MRGSHHLSLSRLDLMRRWEVLVLGATFFDRHDEKFLFGGLQALIELMRIWEVLITSHFKIWLDDKMRSSCLGGCHFCWHDEKMRSSHLGGLKILLILWEYEKFSLPFPSRFDLMRRWEVLVWGAAIFDRHVEKIRSSCLGGLKLLLTWWEYEKFSLSLPSRFDLMGRWEVLVWRLLFFIDIMKRWEVLVWGASSFN